MLSVRVTATTAQHPRSAMHSGRSSEAADICGVLRETIDAVHGLQSITVSTVEGNELLAVSSAQVEGDAAAAGVNQDRAAVFAGAVFHLPPV